MAGDLDGGEKNKRDFQLVLKYSHQNNGANNNGNDAGTVGGGGEGGR